MLIDTLVISSNLDKDFKGKKLNEGRIFLHAIIIIHTFFLISHPKNNQRYPFLYFYISSDLVLLHFHQKDTITDRKHYHLMIY